MDARETDLAEFEISDEQLGDVFGGFQTTAAPSACASTQSSTQLDTASVM